MFRNDYDTFIKLYVKFYRTDRFSKEIGYK